MSAYKDHDAVVTTEWLADHLDDPEVVVVEVDVDTSSYEEGHIPGAVGWNWKTQLQDQQNRDIVSKEDLQDLARQAGINNDSHVILYGDNHNWFAAWALWELNHYGYTNVSLLDGGREKWLNEDRPTTTEIPDVESGDVELKDPTGQLRAFRNDVEETIKSEVNNLVDVRSPEEFTGEVIAPSGMSETAQRGGHVPGATNITWKSAVNEDGTFKSPEELKEVYEGQGISPDSPTITYCRIGERSSHSWFVLTHLLGHNNVKNYDGSWTEWGNLVRAPIEKGN